VIVLALDTTTKAGSAAILANGVVLVEHEGDPTFTHGQRLPGELMRVLDEANVRIEDIELFAVAAGPGSFTGLRVGIATVQGLAMARARRVAPISTLEALARAGIRAGCPIAAWMDAQRGEVFAELYAPDGRGRLIAAQSARPGVILDRWGETTDIGRAVFIGDGAVRYRELIAERAGGRTQVAPAPPLAGLIAEIAAADPARAVLPHAVVPIYIRAPDAELARARRTADKT
jgi:tRNA threonylcarbamoyladenosine biosynthesis protein TsaB